MSAKAVVHPVVLELEEPVPSEVPVGSDIVVKVKVACPRGCDVSGRLVKLMAGEETLTTCVHEEFAVIVPEKLGTYSWTILFPRQEIGGVVHEQASLPIAFETKPLGSSVAIWDVPSPVVTGERFVQQRKAFLLRMNPKLWEELEHWAGDEFRSVNGQIEYLLQRAVDEQRRGKRPGKLKDDSESSPPPGAS